MRNEQLRHRKKEDCFESTTAPLSLCSGLGRFGLALGAGRRNKSEVVPLMDGYANLFQAPVPAIIP